MGYVPSDGPGSSLRCGATSMFWERSPSGRVAPLRRMGDNLGYILRALSEYNHDSCIERPS